jgi:cellobiose transport system substrate-binding protein
MRTMTGRRRAVVAALSAAVLAAVAACGDDDGGDDDGGDSNEPVTLTVHDFGGAGFGYGALVEQYMADHPNITIDYQTVTDDYDGEYRPGLIQQLDAGTAPDIAAFEEQGVGQMMANPDWWVDLSEHGLDAREADYPAWKWELGHAADGRLAGLGTDVGGMLMCYRVDLFQDAGLPTDRNDVTQLFSTWDSFADAAQQFIDSDVDATFVDSINQLYNIRMIQEAGAGDGTSYFDRENNYVAGQSPAVRTAFDYVAQLNEMGAIGEFPNFSDEWFQAMAAGGYATMGCPGWMLGVVADGSGEDNAGNWDVAPVPGVAGNWGGSWIGVTKDSENPEEAAALVDYLTSPESQIAVFEELNNYPSSPTAQQDPRVADSTNEYFNDAPSGQLLAASIQAYQPVFFGALHSAVRTEMENVLVAMVQGQYSNNEDAWNDFIAAGQEVVDLEG